MLLKGVIFGSSDDSDGSVISNNTWLSLEATGKFFAGQDDGQEFVAVLPEDEGILTLLFPRISLSNIQYEEFPWDVVPKGFNR